LHERRSRRADCLHRRSRAALDVARKPRNLHPPQDLAYRRLSADFAGPGGCPRYCRGRFSIFEPGKWVAVTL
jgi:hypothetical protein